MRRVTSVAVTGLLGRFDHSVDIPEDWEFSIIHGPNGVGKTRFLEIIAATFSPRPHVLLNLPFRTATFGFSDGLQLVVSKGGERALPLNDDDEVLEFVEQDLWVSYHVTGGDEDVTWQAGIGAQRISPRVARELERYLPIEQVGPEDWSDIRTGEILTLAEIADRYGDDLPFEIAAWDLPEGLRRVLADVDVHLIETQRLLTFEAPQRGPGPRKRPAQRPTGVDPRSWTRVGVTQAAREAA